MGVYISNHSSKNNVDIKFLSLASAGEWKAMYATENFRGFYWAPVAAWALADVTYKDTGQTNQEILGVVPFDEIGGEKGIAEFGRYFIGYCVELPLNDDEEMATRIRVIKEMIEDEAREKDFAREE